MRRRAFLIVMVLAALVLVPAAALAARPAPFNAAGTIAVTGFSSPDANGASGRVRIESESLASIAPLVSDSEILNGKVLVASQKSNELFDGPDLTTAVALDGTAAGTFLVMDPSTQAVVASGRYQNSISNVAGCQVFNEGHWSTTQQGLQGRGTVTACLNFLVNAGTFIGTITFTGNLD